MSTTVLNPSPTGTEPGTPAGAPPDPARRPRAVSRARQYLAQSSLFLLTAVFLIGFSLLKPDQFANWANIRTILFANAVTAIVALAALLPLLSGEVDISIGGVMGASGVFVAWAFGSGWPAPAAIAGALAIGVVVGAVNAILVVKIGLNSFIATLAITTVLTGVATLITGGGSLYEGIPGSFTAVASNRILGVPLAVVYAVILTALVSYGTSRTAVGRRLRATGTGRDAARLIGVRTPRYVAGAFVAGGLIAAFGGVLETAELGSASPSTGSSFMLSAIAAVFLGAVLSRRGWLNAWGTLLAVLMLGIGLTGLTMAGAPPWVPDVFNGAALLAALIISRSGGQLASVTAFGSDR